MLSECDWHRLAAVVELVKHGYAEQLVLGTDVFIKSMTRRGGAEGYCRLTRWVLPTLRQVGVSEADLECMMRTNPARMLAG